MRNEIEGGRPAGASFARGRFRRRWESYGGQVGGQAHSPMIGVRRRLKLGRVKVSQGQSSHYFL